MIVSINKQKKALDKLEELAVAYAEDLPDDDGELSAEEIKKKEEAKKIRDKKQKENAAMRAREAAAWRKLPKKVDARAAQYRRIEEVGEIDGVDVGESVVYYYGKSLAQAREAGNTPERKCKIEYLADALYRRSTAYSICRGCADVVNSLNGGSGEFELTQEAVKGTELVTSDDGKKIAYDVVKFFYIAKRVARLAR